MAAPDALPAPNPVEELLEKQFGVVFPRLVRIAFVVCPRCDTENIAADAVAKAWKARARFAPGADPWPWLYEITRNTAIDAGKLVAGLPRSQLPIPPDLASSGDIEAELYDFEILEVLRSVVDALPSAQRDTLHRALSFKQGRVPEDYEEARKEAFEAVMQALREKLGVEPSLEFFARLCRSYQEGLNETRD